MLVKTFCAAVNGLEVTTVTVEVSLSRGMLYHLTGLPDNAVKESRDRIAAALTNIGYKFPVADITVGLSPPISAKRVLATTFHWPSASWQQTER